MNTLLERFQGRMQAEETVEVLPIAADGVLVTPPATEKAPVVIRTAKLTLTDDAESIKRIAIQKRNERLAAIRGEGRRKWITTQISPA